MLTFSVTAQNNSNELIAMNAKANVGIFKFKTEIIDYGTIKQNSDGQRFFTFKNIGQSPILISKAKASCGCTVASIPNEPIMPGETAKIGVKYATNRIGSFSKSITLISNANTATKVIKIKGKVIKLQI